MLVGAATVGGFSTARASAGVAAVRAPNFVLTSPAFQDGGKIPDNFTCSGENASPPLRWRGVPKRTIELALIVEDPDARIGTLVHWVAWGIDPADGHLVEQQIAETVKQGANVTGRSGYTGPCPPNGDPPHRYKFTLYALRAPINLASGASTQELRDAMRGSILGRARLVGLYARPGA